MVEEDYKRYSTREPEQLASLDSPHQLRKQPESHLMRWGDSHGNKILSTPNLKSRQNSMLQAAAEPAIASNVSIQFGV